MPHSLLMHVDQIDSFNAVKAFPPKEVTAQHQRVIRALDEREELEPFIRAILADSSDTPHGPAEIVDIFTHKVIARGKPQLTAFILKGKSFSTVRPKHVSHQIYRIEKISGVKLAVFGASGTILDAAKEQFTSTCERLGINYCILDSVDISRLLIAYGFICPRDGKRIIGGRCACGYTPEKHELNILQREALRELREAHTLGQKRGLVVLPTGTGKTRIAAEDAHSFSASSILYVAHTQEILDVAQAEFESRFTKRKVHRHTQATTLKHPKAVNLVTIQLLKNHAQSLKPDMYDYVVIDEFHHAAAPSYRELLDQLSPKFLLGLTATPFRGDRQDISKLCDGNVIVQFELRNGIDSGILSPYHYFGCFDDIDYSKLRLEQGRYNIRDLEKALIIPERYDAVIRKWRELADGKPTLAFCCSMKHARRMSERFNDSGVASEAYLSDTSAEEREDLRNRLEEGDIKILCTVNVLNEGADFPWVECLLFLRPTESKRIFFQQLGRGLRRSVGKAHCVVIDFIGNFRNAYRIVEYHGLLPYSDDQPASSFSAIHNKRELLNLPLGCRVNFDEKVIDIISEQTIAGETPTRHNIARILIYQYQRLGRSLGHRPTARDMDHYALLPRELYAQVFGSWRKFERNFGQDD